MTTQTLTKLLIAAVLLGSAGAYAQQTPMQRVLDDRKPNAQFKMGGVRCSVVESAIRCAPGSK